MKILTVNTEKGGVGKTTITWNFAEWLARHHKVLLLDLDEIRNLTNRYTLDDFPYQATILPIFEEGKGSPEVQQVKDNIDLIAGDRKLTNVKQTLATKSGERYFLMRWLSANYETLSKRYDYVLIDTHPDFSVVTDNALAISDVVLTITQPSPDEVIAMASEENHIKQLSKLLVNPVTNETFVHAKVVKVGNRIQHNTNASRSFVESISSFGTNFLGYFQERSVVNIANNERVPLVELCEEEKYHTQPLERFFGETFNLFQAIKDTLDEGEKNE